MKFVLSGPPASGKTTLLEALARRGYDTIPEAARQVIAEQQQEAVPVLPWTDLPGFERLVQERIARNERAYRGRTTFFDRSHIDIAGYCSEAGVAVPEGHHEHVRKAGYATVFLLERLPRYATDGIRFESEWHAIRIGEHLRRAYERTGCDIVPVPACYRGDDAESIRASVEQRLAIIEEHVSVSGPREHEGKYAMPHAAVRPHLRANGLEQRTLVEQHDHYYRNPLGLAVRIRYARRSRLTIKGRDRGTTHADRFELEFPLPRGLAAFVTTLVPGYAWVRKTRAEYRGLSPTTISLDAVEGLGEFVEIEGPPAAIATWKERLGITGEHLGRSYEAMAAGR